MNGKWFVGGIAGFTAVFGAGLWYAMNFAYYEQVTDVKQVVAQGELFAVSDYKGIDAGTSPLKMRACFTIDRPFAPLGPRDDLADPLIAPFWFGCFDAEQIAADIAAGKALSIRAARNEPFGFTRFIAQYPDGRAYMWRQINACGKAQFGGEDLPVDCKEETAPEAPVQKTSVPALQPAPPTALTTVTEVIRLEPLIGDGPEEIATGAVQAVAAADRPLAFHGCFGMEQSFGLLTETYVTAEPATPAPVAGGLPCFDSEQLIEDLRVGYAVAFWSERDIAPGVDRVVAVYDDGRAFVWHQKNNTYAE